MDARDSNCCDYRKDQGNAENGNRLIENCGNSVEHDRSANNPPERQCIPAEASVLQQLQPI